MRSVTDQTRQLKEVMRSATDQHYSVIYHIPVNNNVHIKT